MYENPNRQSAGDYPECFLHNDLQNDHQSCTKNNPPVRRKSSLSINPRLDVLALVVIALLITFIVLYFRKKKTDDEDDDKTKDEDSNVSE